jgi:hypothetical protein
MLLTRRKLLIGGAVAVGTYVAVPGLPVFALPESATATSGTPAVPAEIDAQFMRLSSLLINHQLDTGVGARITAFAMTAHPDLPKMMDGIIAIAQQKNAASVEDFFGDIPAGPMQDLAHWIISAWYSGSSSAKHDAEVFTYELALTYQVTKDVTQIPSYGLSGPNAWTRPNAALADMPQF